MTETPSTTYTSLLPRARRLLEPLCVKLLSYWDTESQNGDFSQQPREQLWRLQTATMHFMTWKEKRLSYNLSPSKLNNKPRSFCGKNTFSFKKNPPSSMWGYSCQGRSSSLPNIQFIHIQAQFSEFLNSVLGFCHQVTLAHRQCHTAAFERYCLKQSIIILLHKYHLAFDKFCKHIMFS